MHDSKRLNIIERANIWLMLFLIALNVIQNDIRGAMWIFVATLWMARYYFETFKKKSAPLLDLKISKELSDKDTKKILEQVENAIMKGLDNAEEMAKKAKERR